jgi:hypothetical protein
MKEYQSLMPVQLRLRSSEVKDLLWKMTEESEVLV